MLFIKRLQNGLSNQIHSMHKAPSLIAGTREVFKSITNVLDHCIIVGGIITSNAKYLQCTTQVSNPL